MLFLKKKPDYIVLQFSIECVFAMISTDVKKR